MNNWREKRSIYSKGLSENDEREGKQKTAKGFKNGRIERPCSIMQSTHLNNNSMQNYLDSCSPDRHQVAQLKSTTKAKKAKLLSSKSLSRLVPRNLFFKRNCSSINNANNNNANEDNNNKLTTTKSFPSAAARSYPSSEAVAMELTDEPLVNLMGYCEPNLSTANTNSIPLVGLPRQSTRNLFNKVECSTPFSRQSQIFSPILGIGEQSNRASLSEPFSFFSTTDSGFDSLACQSIQSRSVEPESGLELPKEAGECGGEKKKKSKSAFRSTTLVLRDVKNSIGLRIKARQESQAFAKLTNELTSPPTKLYSPFNIYATDSASKPRKEPSKSKRKLNLASNKRQVSKATADTDQNCSIMSVDDEVGEATPKHRVALQHKRHLLQANKFTFDSPAGRLRETVKDVEHFQQCIEDISKAIRARDRSL